MDEAYFLQAFTMFFLSLWKTYIGPLMAAGFGFSYGEMLIYNLGAALIATLSILYTSDWLLAHRNARIKGFDKNLRRFLRYWRKYGKWGAALLSPVLFGIPTYAFVARRLKDRRRDILKEIGVVTFIWCSLLYWLGLQGIIMIEAENFLYFSK